MTAIGRPIAARPTHWTAADITGRISLTDAVGAVRQGILLADEGRLEQPLRQSLGDGRLLVMAARSTADGDAVVKTVRVGAHAGDGTGQGVDGMVLIVDGSTGQVVTADGSAMTLLRTAGLVALATEVLAPPQASSLGILGAGRQARELAIAMATVRPVTSLRIWNRTRTRADLLATELSAALPAVRVQVADTAAAAVRDSEIICCATASTTELFDSGDLRSDAHVNAIGSYRPDMHEIPTAAMGDASMVVVDDPVACLGESGEIIDAVAQGIIGVGSLRSLAGVVRDRPFRSGLTIFKSVGTAAADFGVAGLLRGRPAPVTPAGTAELGDVSGDQR